MNNQQIRYCQDRVRKAFNLKFDRLREKHLKAVKITDKVKLDYIRDGRLELKKGVSLRTPLGKAFDFSEIDKDDILDRKALDKDVAALKVAMNVVLDLVNLDNNDKKTMAAVLAFCKGT